MKYPELSHQELPKNYDCYTTEFFLPERENPVAILRYKTILRQVIIDAFCTINWTYQWDINVFWMRDMVDRMWKFDFWKNLYPWIWMECLDLFIRQLHESEKSYRSLEFRSAPSAIWFYKKAALRLLESWNISSWEQWNGWELVKKIPFPVINRLYLDYLFKSLSNPDRFTFHLQQLPCPPSSSISEWTYQFRN